MIREHIIPLVTASCFVLVACTSTGQEKKPEAVAVKDYEVQLTDEEWRKRLTPEEYRILRQKGTEYAWSGEYNKFKKKGVFTCAGCSNPLFSSDSKYDSGSGWPSYWQPIDEQAVATETDKTLGMTRTEVLCGKCGGHLGHVFPDGPRPTGLRYCINSVSLDFEEKKKDEK